MLSGSQRQHIIFTIRNRHVEWSTVNGAQKGGAALFGEGQRYHGPQGVILEIISRLGGRF
jgi:hypothetical protein